MKILVIEDEVALLQDIKKYLEGENLIVETASDCHQAQTKIAGFEYDCIVIDINLPDGSGFDVIKSLKEQRSKAGVLIISARHSLDDKILGLNIGADDYLVKPFHLSELNARINSINRRRLLEGNNRTCFREICIDHNSQTVTVNGAIVVFTHKEFDILTYFIANKNKVLTQMAIVEHLWQDDIELTDSYNFLYTHIRNIRKKIQDVGCPNYLKSVYGIGYKWEDA